MDEIIRMDHISKSYFVGTPNELQVLKNMNILIHEGEFVSIVGQSGSGKSTLMNILGALDRPSSGQYKLDGQDIGKLSDDDLSEIRSRKIGFVFQTFNLIPKSSALSNIELPMIYSGIHRAARIKRAKELLEMVGMGDRMEHLSNELSGGQKQRVAIARALANNPSIILADEPTGALDSKTGRRIMDIFHELHQNHGKTIILITHNEELAAETDRVIAIKDGCIIEDHRTEKKVIP